jgi:hypothetical protein
MAAFFRGRWAAKLSRAGPIDQTFRQGEPYWHYYFACMSWLSCIIAAAPLRSSRAEARLCESQTGKQKPRGGCCGMGLIYAISEVNVVIAKIHAQAHEVLQ